MVKLIEHRELLVALVALGLLAAYIIIPMLPTRAQSMMLVASEVNGEWTQIQFPTKSPARYNGTDIDSASTSEMALPAYMGRVHIVIELFVFGSHDQAMDELDTRAEYYVHSQGYNLSWTDIGDAAFYNISSVDREWSIIEFCEGDTMVLMTVYGHTNNDSDFVDYDILVTLRSIAVAQAQKI